MSTLHCYTFGNRYTHIMGISYFRDGADFFLFSKQMKMMIVTMTTVTMITVIPSTDPLISVVVGVLGCIDVVVVCAGVVTLVESGSKSGKLISTG